MRDGRRILDADGHVIEPGGIFGPLHRADHNPITTSPNTPYEMCGGADLSDLIEHGFNAPSYLRAMDAQGIDAAVLYPSVGLFVPFQADLTLDEQTDACRRYNDWITSYCSADPARLFGVGIAPVRDMQAAPREVERAASLGAVAMMVRPNFLWGRNVGDPFFDPLYEALAASGVPLAVHEGFGVQAGPTIGADRFDGFTLRHMCCHPMEQMCAMASLVVDGALERHPTMKVAFLESGTGWLPYWLARLDDHIEWMAGSETKGLSCSASEFFARQCIISSDPEDPLVASTVAAVGADHVVWASDFPHPDAAFPDALDEFLHHNPSVAPADLDAILWDTPVAFYGLADRV